MLITCRTTTTGYTNVYPSSTPIEHQRRPTPAEENRIQPRTKPPFLQTATSAVHTI